MPDDGVIEEEFPACTCGPSGEDDIHPPCPREQECYENWLLNKETQVTTTETRTELSENQQAWLIDTANLVAFLKANPDLWTGMCDEIRVYHPIWECDHDDVVGFMASAARAMAPCEKEAGTDATGKDFHLTKKFGQHELILYTRRENVCTKRVVGTEIQEVEALSDADQALVDSLPKITKTVEVEKVEWECPPLLSR